MSSNNLSNYPPEIVEIALAKTNQAIIDAQEKEMNYNYEWADRRTARGRNYNGGKYESPYAEDDAGKAAVMGFFIGLFAIIFFWG